MANQQFATPYGRLSFPNFLKARAYEDGAQEFFDGALLIPKIENLGKNRFDGAPFSPYVALRGLDGAKVAHDLAELRAAVKERITEKWGNKPPKLRNAFRDCDAKDADADEDTEGAAPEQVGHILIRAKSKRRPRFFDAAKQDIGQDEIEQMFYPGAWVRFIVGLYDYDGKANKGVGFGLRGVQFLRNDTPFAGKLDLDAISAIPDAEQAPADAELGDMA